MPRPRFQNLPEEKRHAIIEAAAKEFAQHGYEQASLNRILETVGMSKGAAYYYFDNKADVFMAAVRHYMEEIVGIFSLEIETVSAENFWPSIKYLYAEQLRSTLIEPWRFGVLRAVFNLFEDANTSQPSPEFKEYMAEFWSLVNRLLALVDKGQSLGVIRRDLPQSLLINLLIGFDTGVDNWFLQSGAEYPSAELEPLLEKITNSLQKLLEPPN